MKRTKSKVLVALLVAGVLCMGTVTAFANSIERSIDGITFVANTTAGPTAAFAQTYTTSSELNTFVSATYSYVDFVDHVMYTDTSSSSGTGTSSMVRFYVPSASRHEVYDITAYHEAWTDNEFWSGNTYEKYE